MEVTHDSSTNQEEQGYDDTSSSSSTSDEASTSTNSSSSTSYGISHNISLPPVPDGATGAAATDYWLALRDTAKKLKKERKTASKRKKKSKSSADVLFRYLVKAVNDYQLPVLNYDPSPSRRRGKFNHFLEKLKLVTSAVRQTKNVLSNPAKPRPPKRKAANQALYRVLCSRTEQYVRTQLNQLTEQLGREDGHQAVLLLRKLHADQNDLDYQQHAINAFNTVRLKEEETIFSFNKRFGYLYHNVAACGIKMTDEEQAQIYLRALRLHRDPRILYEVKSQYEKLEKGRSKGLTEIQRLLLHEEELSQSQDYTTRPTTRRDPKSRPTAHANNVTRQHKKAMATQSNKIHNSKRTSLGPCHGCGKQGHLLRDCKTTSEADKKCIWDMIRSSKHSLLTYL